MDHVEIARAESERGELVLRERRPDDGPISLELRVNGVFVRRPGGVTRVASES